MAIDKAKQIPDTKIALEQKLQEQQAILQTAQADAEFIRRPHCRDAGEIAEERDRAVIIDNTLQQAQQSIRQIKIALGKIATDEYGYCDRCGDEISPQRLSITPEVAFCLNCQEKIDNRSI
ncbi:TraR/DksA family transcriptional regulator [Cocleimonas flava]|uniref:TraR/DksA family transcriptional regulator n=1 Tax=Cocleimonas flava TaxID=634765 RepID=A0A4R1F4V9_9GAMM|nr:TraR/DksA C4-type zinc finger protein [Cocleimonas flava]TCJ88883.1 TraR/DksA family transcriptional regulator [Cocleimonas flava]